MTTCTCRCNTAVSTVYPWLSEPIDLEMAVRVGGARTWLLEILKEDIKIYNVC